MRSFFDLANAILLLYMTHLVRYWYPASCEAEKDAVVDGYLVGMCFILALVLQPSLTSIWFANVIRAFSKYRRVMLATAFLSWLFSVPVVLFSQFACRSLECTFHFWFIGSGRGWSSHIWYFVMPGIMQIFLHSFWLFSPKCSLEEFKSIFSQKISVCDLREEEEEVFITSGNWRGKHNSLSRGAGADQP